MPGFSRSSFSRDTRSYDSPRLTNLSPNTSKGTPKFSTDNGYRMPHPGRGDKNNSQEDKPGYSKTTDNTLRPGYPLSNPASQCSLAENANTEKGKQPPDSYDKDNPSHNPVPVPCNLYKRIPAFFKQLIMLPPGHPDCGAHCDGYQGQPKTKQANYTSSCRD